MTPEEYFAYKMYEIKSLYSGDKEVMHCKMDSLRCDTLDSLGYTKGVDIFLEAEKWYA